MGDTVRCWLVERSFDDGRIITTTYATPAGDQTVTRQRSLAAVGDGVPASVEVRPDELTDVDDADRRDWYRSEVSRLEETHDPDELL